MVTGIFNIDSGTDFASYANPVESQIAEFNQDGLVQNVGLQAGAPVVAQEYGLS